MVVSKEKLVKDKYDICYKKQHTKLANSSNKKSPARCFNIECRMVSFMFMECFKRCPFSPASHSLIFKTPMSPSISVFCLQCVCCSLSIQLLHVTVSAPYHLLEFTLTGPPLCALLSRGYFVLFNGIPTSAAIRTSCTSARPALQVFTSQKHCMQFTF